MTRIRSFSDVEDLRQFWISLSQDDAAFERQEHLSSELQDAVGVRPVDAQLPPVGGIIGVCLSNILSSVLPVPGRNEAINVEAEG